MLLSQQDGGTEYEICHTAVTQWQDLQNMSWL